MNPNFLDKIELSHYSDLFKIREVIYSKEKSLQFLNQLQYTESDLEECTKLLIDLLEDHKFFDHSSHLMWPDDLTDILMIISEQLLEIYYIKMFSDKKYALKTVNLCENIWVIKDTINAIFLEAKANYILGKMEEVESSHFLIQMHYPDFDYMENWNDFLQEVDQHKTNSKIEHTSYIIQKETESIITETKFLWNYPYAIETLQSFLDNNEYSLFRETVQWDQIDCEQLELMFAHILCEIKWADSSIQQSDKMYLTQDFWIIIARYLANTYYYEWKKEGAFKICESSELITKDPLLMEITAKIYAESWDIETASLIFDELSQFFPNYKK